MVVELLSANVKFVSGFWSDEAAAFVFVVEFPVTVGEAS